MSLLHCCLFLLYLNSVRTTDDYYEHALTRSSLEIERRFSLWPSVLNAATSMKLRKRQALDTSQEQIGEGGGVGVEANKQLLPVSSSHSIQQTGNVQAAIDKTNETSVKQDLPKVPVNNSTSSNDTIIPQATSSNETKLNLTSTVKTTPDQLDLKNPGVVVRAVIVFGGFALLAVAYFIFYRRKNDKVDSNTHNINDVNQFRYGVLQSEDRRENIDLSRIPLTMESDEDDDEDLEIFDLGQKKKSLSYVNLQTNDEDVVFGSSENTRDNDRDNLLLDIEDRGAEALINWTNNSNKSLL